MIHLFCGYDAREAIGFHVFVASVLQRASVPVAIHPLDAKGLPAGSNSFTFSRFLVPYLMGFKGHAIFADASDMLMLADIAELDALFNPGYALQVVQHPDYSSRHARKYVGTGMECDQSNYDRKNWASLMLINCEHPAWGISNPLRIRQMAPLDLLQLRFALSAEIGTLDSKWNRLVDEGHPVESAAVLHWSSGIPGFTHYANAPGAEHWFEQRSAMLAVA
jgi:hypothetical protein